MFTIEAMTLLSEAIAIFGLIALLLILLQVIRDYRKDRAMDKQRAQLKRERMKVRLEVEREADTKLFEDESYDEEETASMTVWDSAMQEIEGIRDLDD